MTDEVVLTTSNISRKQATKQAINETMENRAVREGSPVLLFTKIDLKKSNIIYFLLTKALSLEYSSGVILPFSN